MDAPVVALAVLLVGCLAGVAVSWAGDQEEETYAQAREAMVTRQIAARGVQDERVLQALRKVPRHRFVPESERAYAYEDHPLPIGEGQTISQPYIVAYMTEALALKPGDRVLEIGTGSGYQAAVLAELAAEVYTIEIVRSLGEAARKTLEGQGYTNSFLKIGDGYQGWPDKAPFDAIIVTCAPDDIPRALVEQLREGGRMMIPVGSVDSVQRLVRVTKTDGKLHAEDVMAVRFVPMVKAK